MNEATEKESSQDRCPICEKVGKPIGQTPACVEMNPRPLYGCERCDHKWIPISVESSMRTLEEITHRESITPNADWVLQHLDTDLGNRTGIRLLDVGCWDGSFLASCPNSWLRHGVEPNMRAAVFARERGLEIFSQTLEVAKLQKDSYNLVVMLDVLEHLPQPLPALRKVSEILTSDGYLFGLTGNIHSRGARIFQGCWYYYNYPEHVTFFSPSSLKIAMESLGLKVKVMKKYRPQGSSWLQTGKKIKNLLFHTQEKEAPHLPVPVRKQDMIKLGISRMLRGRNHMIIVAQKEK